MYLLFIVSVSLKYAILAPILNKKCDTEKIHCSRPGVTEELSKCILLDRVWRAPAVRRGPCRLTRLPAEDRNPNVKNLGSQY